MDSSISSNDGRLLIMEVIPMTSSFLLAVERDGNLWSAHLVQMQPILMVRCFTINFSGTQNATGN